VVRLVPTTDTVPAGVNQFLLPSERHVISVREHPAVLIPRTALVLAGLALAGWLSNAVAHGDSATITVIWVLWGLLVVWLLIRIAEWRVHWFVVTSHRLILREGIIVRRVNMIPLAKVSDVEYRQPQTARLLGYAEFEILAPGMGDRMRQIKYIPYPDQLYLEVCGLMFGGDKEDSGD
jgi:uncharacterized membrane protein YdbT with pleckstrin-like domain